MGNYVHYDKTISNLPFKMPTSSQIRSSLIGHSHFHVITFLTLTHAVTSVTCLVRLHVIPSLSNVVLHCAALNSLIFPMYHCMFFTAFYFGSHTQPELIEKPDLIDHPSSKWPCLFKIMHVKLYKNSTSITDIRIYRKKLTFSITCQWKIYTEKITNKMDLKVL